MRKNIWQFSLRALLVLMTIVAIVVAFTANYPWVALLIAGAATWILFESGAIIHIVLWLAKPRVFARYPLLAMAIWLLAGVLSCAVSGIFWWSAINTGSAALFWMPLIPALISPALPSTVFDSCGCILGDPHLRVPAKRRPIACWSDAQPGIDALLVMAGFVSSP